MSVAEFNMHINTWNNTHFGGNLILCKELPMLPQRGRRVGDILEVEYLLRIG